MGHANPVLASTILNKAQLAFAGRVGLRGSQAELVLHGGEFLQASGTIKAKSNVPCTPC